MQAISDSGLLLAKEIEPDVPQPSTRDSMFLVVQPCSMKKSMTCRISLHEKNCKGTLQRSANHRSCMHIQITLHQIPGRRKNSCAISSTQAPTWYDSKNSCNSHTDFTPSLCQLRSRTNQLKLGRTSGIHLCCDKHEINQSVETQCAWTLKMTTGALKNLGALPHKQLVTGSPKLTWKRKQFKGISDCCLLDCLHCQWTFKIGQAISFHYSQQFSETNRPMPLQKNSRFPARRLLPFCSH